MHDSLGCSKLLRWLVWDIFCWCIKVPWIKNALQIENWVVTEKHVLKELKFNITQSSKYNSFHQGSFMFFSRVHVLASYFCFWGWLVFSSCVWWIGTLWHVSAVWYTACHQACRDSSLLRSDKVWPNQCVSIPISLYVKESALSYMAICLTVKSQTFVYSSKVCRYQMEEIIGFRNIMGEKN